LPSKRQNVAKQRENLDDFQQFFSLAQLAIKRKIITNHLVLNTAVKGCVYY